MPLCRPNCTRPLVASLAKNLWDTATVYGIGESEKSPLSLAAATIGTSPEELKTMLDDAGFIQTEIHRKKPSYATIIGMRP